MPKIKGLAESFEFKYKEIFNTSEVESGIDWLIKGEGPRLLDVRVSPTEEAIPRLISKANSKGIMETAPYEDLWPELESL
jgi:thiamine pyrophosphate-dependent acetolactate synthase large subunit-like protein